MKIALIPKILLGAVESHLHPTIIYKFALTLDSHLIVIWNITIIHIRTMHTILVIALINEIRIFVSNRVSMFILIVVEMIIIAVLLHMGRESA